MFAGRIWLNNMWCTHADILDQCSYDFYNSSSDTSKNCRSNHRDDAGVICEPGMLNNILNDMHARKDFILFVLDPDDFLPPPQNFTASNDDTTSSTSITFKWNVSG